ncbi:MAG: hypothetical protein WCV50_01910 [Patescibacteria group bacterium]|jgi:N-acetylglutamate synthase-like GNAT family acetyltransferase
MINFRKATCEDSPAVSRLLRSKYSFTTSDEAAATYNSECLAQHYRLAEREGKIIGLVSWRPQGIAKHGVAELTRIAVDSDEPDIKTVKEMLFDVTVAEADYYYKQHDSKLRKVFSMIHADNVQIRNFFVDKGMRQEAVLKDHFYSGKDELVFSLFFPTV